MKPQRTPEQGIGFRTGHFFERKQYHTYRENGTTDWLIIYTVSGSGLFTHPQASFHSKKGTIHLIPPGQLHNYGLVDKKTHWELLWAHFLPRPDWSSLLDWPTAVPGVRYLKLDDSTTKKNVHRALTEMHRWYLSPQIRSEMFAMNALENALLWCNTQNKKNKDRFKDQRILKAMEFISENIHLPLTVEKVSKEVHLSPSRLSHLFKEQTQTTVIHYIESVRLNRAKELLEFSQRPISEIAEKLGFEDPFYFTKRFKKQYSINPRAYRQKFQETKR